jgi:membrane protease YdiL (CAAX protease family)
MPTTIRRPILGVLVAIAITTSMDASGLSTFSALPLFPLALVFWHFDRLSRRDVGLSWGARRHYALAVLYPLLVLGVLTLVLRRRGHRRHAWTGQGVAQPLRSSPSRRRSSRSSPRKVLPRLVCASLSRAGLSAPRVLIWSSVAFALWHVSAVLLPTGFDLPRSQVPVFIVNAAVIGAIWGLMRWLSGSVLVASVSHGVWNGAAYVLFGFGTKVGALGIAETAFMAPGRRTRSRAQRDLCVSALANRPQSHAERN